MAIKWIGGASLLTVLFFGSVAATGAWLERDNASAQTAAPAIDAPASLPQAEPDHEIVEQHVADLPAPQEATADAPQLALADTFVIKSILPIDGPIRYGEYHWDESRAPANGKLVITVDLEARVISVFRDGHEIGAAAVLLGTQDHPTPTGTFPILEMKRHNISSIYNVPMPYTMRLTWDGISIHSSEVENGYASHGCIGTPDPFAAKLFAIAKKGDIVIITRGKRVGVGDPLLG